MRRQLVIRIFHSSASCQGQTYQARRLSVDDSTRALAAIRVVVKLGRCSGQVSAFVSVVVHDHDVRAGKERVMCSYELEVWESYDENVRGLPRFMRKSILILT